MQSHKCRLPKDETNILKLNRFRKLCMISSDNPLSLGSFRSKNSILEEKLRHRRENKYTIHPFSKFKAWYDMFLVYLYLSVLVTKPMDAAFMRTAVTRQRLTYKIYTLTTDIFCWVDISLNFITGYEIPRYKIVELRPELIAKKYVFSPFFICDVLSSLPKGLFYLVGFNNARTVLGVISLLGMFKVVRIISVVNCIRRSAEYLGFKSRGFLFLMFTIIASILTIHWVACLQFAVPKFVRVYFTKEVDKSSWFFEDKGMGPLYQKNIFIQYIHCFFKSSAYILGIRLRLYQLDTKEEFVLVIATYFVGKIILGFVWIILTVTILNSRLMDIKFAEVINQLEEYMRQKQLPLGLRDRISQYFKFKYRGRYFKEDLITSLLSDNLRKETNLHVRRALLNSVSLFKDMSAIEMSKLVDYLIPEIFLPSDTIIHAGTQGDAMYFLSSGTVAVFTRSGKEVCHLQDGAFFGEISLLLKGQLRLTTIVALETSQVYRLNKKDLEMYLLSNKQVMGMMLSIAEARIKETTRMEEEYKEMLFEQSYRKIPSADGT